MRRFIPPILAALAAMLALALLGCESRVIDLRDPQPADPVPEPVSPARAIDRMVWSLTRLEPLPCEDLITADFRFVYAARDSAGRAVQWFRETELLCLTNLLKRGTSAHPPAYSITLATDGPLVFMPSSFPGHDPRWHREAHVTLSLGIRTHHGDFAVMGAARFFVVRGDSARIPQALRDRGYGPDSTRWWIERWEDETVAEAQPVRAGRPVAPLTATPARLWTLGEIKTLYLEPPPAP